MINCVAFPVCQAIFPHSVLNRGHARGVDKLAREPRYCKDTLTLPISCHVLPTSFKSHSSMIFDSTKRYILHIPSLHAMKSLGEDQSRRSITAEIILVLTGCDHLRSIFEFLGGLNRDYLVAGGVNGGRALVLRYVRIRVLISRKPTSSYSFRYIMAL